MNLVQFFNKPSSLVYILFILSSKHLHQLFFFIVNCKNSFTPYWKHKQWLVKSVQFKQLNFDAIQGNSHLYYKIHVVQNYKVLTKTLLISTANSNINKFNLSFRLLPATPPLRVTSMLLQYINFYFNNFNASAILFLLNFQKVPLLHLRSTINKTSVLFTSKNEYYTPPLLLHNIKNL